MAKINYVKLLFSFICSKLFQNVNTNANQYSKLTWFVLHLLYYYHKMTSKPNISINRLILIGNGFDLAHKLKTSYGDFILWYFKKYWDQAKYSYNTSETNEKPIYCDTDLITIFINHSNKRNKPLEFEINTIDDVKTLVNDRLNYPDPPYFSCKIKSVFFKSLVDNFFNKNWVDIENHYYKHLSNIIKINGTKLPNPNIDLGRLTSLNQHFTAIKDELQLYLRTLDQPKKINAIADAIYEPPINPPHIEQQSNDLVNTVFLNFNYTSTPEQYIGKNSDIIYIHGQLNNTLNPIIFGYGDEHDESYSILEDAIIPDVFTHIKSFDYFQTNNYSKLLAFLESPYDVYIMGHSCGLSDRTLLNTIFEHSNCRLIKTFYYENKQKYRETTYEISRHFSIKSEMRSKVINFADCSPMPQLQY